MGKNIEITPQMVEAVLEVLVESGRLAQDRLEGGDAVLATQLISAAWRARPVRRGRSQQKASPYRSNCAASLLRRWR
jgi:hypothetical protein